MFMMTSLNESIFRVTGSLCGEFTGPGEFPTQRPVTRSFDIFFDLRLNKRLSKQPWGWWFETPSWSSWRQCNVYPNMNTQDMGTWWCGNIFRLILDHLSVESTGQLWVPSTKCCLWILSLINMRHACWTIYHIMLCWTVPLRHQLVYTRIARFMGPTWGSPGADRTQMGPMLA